MFGQNINPVTRYFNFAGVSCGIRITENPPAIHEIIRDFQSPESGGALPRTGANIILVCDGNTEYIARLIKGNDDIHLCRIKPGEANKNWRTVEKILLSAKNAGLGRDGLFIGAGGGVITDLTGFAASVYMRGARLALVPTTLLGMVDASIGGKTGFDIFGRKNMAGSFYPASRIYIPLSALDTLPQKELKSGFAEIIKCAILEGTEGEIGSMQGAAGNPGEEGCRDFRFALPDGTSALPALIENTIKTKGRIAGNDPKETGTERALLNLGHTFGHALESAAGLGTIPHGEAVAWGIVRAAELGMESGITPPERAGNIISLIKSFSYETAAIHPAIRSKKGMARFNAALGDDKKKKNGALRFIVPNKTGAEIITCDWELKY